MGKLARWPSIGAERQVQNMSQEWIHGLSLAAGEVGVSGVQLSGLQHMYTSVISPGSVVEACKRMGVVWNEAEADNLGSVIEEALPSTARWALELATFPLEIHTTDVTSRGGLDPVHFLVAASSRYIATERQSARRAIDDYYAQRSDYVPRWHDQHSGLRLAASADYRQLLAFGRYLCTEVELLPEYIEYAPVEVYRITL